MKQMSYIIHEEADYLAMQWEVRVALGEMEVSQVHISVCGTERDEESAEAVIGRLRRDFPKGEIIGCMAAEVVINGSVACDGILVSFSIFESARVEILGFSSEEMTPREMGQKLRARLEEIEHPKMVGILLSDVTMDITGFLEEASKCSEDIKFFGGISDEGKMGARGRDSPVWVRTWPCSSQGLEKAFPQVLQTQGSVWLRMCILRAPRLIYSLLQYLQLKALRDWGSLATESPVSCLGNWPKPGKAA